MHPIYHHVLLVEALIRNTAEWMIGNLRIAAAERYPDPCVDLGSARFMAIQPWVKGIGMGPADCFQERDEGHCSWTLISDYLVLPFNALKAVWSPCLMSKIAVAQQLLKL